MRIRQPDELDLRSILDAAFTARVECPDLWSLWLQETYVDDGWHSKKSKRYWHHASGLGGCDRKAVLKRFGVEQTTESVESMVAFEVGHHFHLLIQFGLAVHPEYELVAHELGGYLPQLGLAARGDCLYRYKDEIIYLELKTEKSGAAGFRRRRADKEGRISSAAPEHQRQAAATRMVISVTNPELTPTKGWIAYFDKNDGSIDQQPIEWENMAPEVVGVIHYRNAIYKEAKETGELPPPIEGFPDERLCKPRRFNDPAGMYCTVREACIRLHRGETTLAEEMQRGKRD